MTELDLELPGLASELISEYGKAVSYSVQGGSTYDPETGAVSVSGGLQSLKAIVEPDKGQAARMGLVEGADYKLTVASEAFGQAKPSTGDTVEFDNSTYTVSLVKATYSGELIALYEIWVGA